MDSKTTALYSSHQKSGAKIIDFSGWQLPVRYSSIIEEHQHTRKACSLFDVSHMGEFRVKGYQALDFLQYMTIGDISKIQVGGGIYTAICNESGGMIDDLLLYRLASEDYLLCVNAANIQKDFQWLQKHQKEYSDLELTDCSGDFSQIAIQGPTSLEAISKAFPEQAAKIADLNYTAIAALDLFQEKVFVARTGYTGEKGYEIYLPNQCAEKVWEKLLDQEGVKPAGLGCRDTLRLEACYLLYGQDMDETVTPLEAGIGWATKLSKQSFLGKDALVDQKNKGVPRKNIAFKLLDKGIPRSDMRVLKDGEVIGKVTSGSMLSTLEFAGGMALVENLPNLKAGDSIEIDVRGKPKRAEIIKKPMYTGSLKN